MNKNHNCFIMGYPAAGKTTFLAALFHVVFNARNSADSPVYLNNMGKSEYLSSLNKDWVNAKQLNRTVLENEKLNISIELKHKKRDIIFTLNFPDLSGETFKNIYATRTIEKSLFLNIENADTILLFINVGGIKKIPLISNINYNFKEEENGNSKVRDPQNDDPDSIKLIELL